MADYKKILRSSHFTFLVGQEQTPLTVHAAIVQNLSEPLYTLINNGLMKESVSRVATLDDVETHTFIAFCEYAYTGAYVTPDRTPIAISEDEPEPEPSNSRESFSIFSRKYDYEKTEPTMPQSTFRRPPESSSIFSAKYDHEKTEPTMPQLLFGGPPQPAIMSQDALKRGAPTTNTSKSNNGKRVDAIYPYEGLWEQFRSRSFGVKSSLRAKDPDIVFHAKLYVFATKYLVEPLRQQCLKSLHRDLLAFSLNSESASLILDLLDFTYANTGRYEPGGKSPLRDLVIHYVACEARTLGDNERFAQILDSNAEMGSDLVAKLVR